LCINRTPFGLLVVSVHDSSGEKIMYAKLNSFVSASFRAARKGAGLLVVLAAVAGTAQAVTPPPPGGSEVPEIAPGALISFVALASGGVLMLTDKFRRK
jgi:hypothetical protein